MTPFQEPNLCNLGPRFWGAVAFLLLPLPDPPARPAAGGRVGEVGRAPAGGGPGGRQDGAGHPGGLMGTVRWTYI